MNERIIRHCHIGHLFCDVLSSDPSIEESAVACEGNRSSKSQMHLISNTWILIMADSTYCDCITFSSVPKVGLVSVMICIDVLIVGVFIHLRKPSNIVIDQIRIPHIVKYTFRIKIGSSPVFRLRFCRCNG